MSEQRLYMMENPFGLRKIGISYNPLRRRRQLELASGSPVCILKAWITEDARPRQVEQDLHVLFARKRQYGEWFKDLSVREVEMAGYELLECNHDGTPKRREECGFSCDAP